MFSENNKISKRQMFRLLAFDLLGIGTLVLPPAIAGEAGKNGMAAICLGIAAGFFYAILIGWVMDSMEENESYPAFLKRSLGAAGGSLALVFYALYYLFLGGYAAYIFGHLMRSELLKEQPFYVITAGILLLCIYGAMHGIEGRARVYEILFWFLLAPLFLMLFFAAGDVEIPRLFPLFTRGMQGIFTGGMQCFSVFSIGGMALFLVPFAKKKNSIRGACMGAVFFSGALFLVLYGILQGMFGTAAMQTLSYPAVTLMSMVQVPGGFVERQDAFMIAIWFFTVFALLGSSLFYASENLKALAAGRFGKAWIVLSAAVFFLIAAAGCQSAGVAAWMEYAFLYETAPFALFIPLAAGIAGKMRKGKGKRTAAALLFLCVLPFFSGCSTAELENRAFPLAMGIDLTEDGCRISYKFQNLSAVADENADASGGTDFFIADRDFFTAVSKYANETNKRMDYNHMKALVLSERFVEDEEALSSFLRICAKENLLARSTLLFFAEDAAEILRLDENLDTAIGSYLEEMMEGREDYRFKDAVTLGDLMNEAENKEQLLLVPVLREKGGIPAVGGYYAIAYGKTKGEVDAADAAMAFLSQGKLKKMSFSMEDQTAVTVNRIVQKGEFIVKDGVAAYRCRIRLEAVVSGRTDLRGSAGERKEREIEALVTGQLVRAERNLFDTAGVDLTDSFYRRGMAGHGLYERYLGDPEGFGRAVRREFAVEAAVGR